MNFSRSTTRGTQTNWLTLNTESDNDPDYTGDSRHLGVALHLTEVCTLRSALVVMLVS